MEFRMGAVNTKFIVGLESGSVALGGFVGFPQ
jgi:hypothetical protein